MQATSPNNLDAATITLRPVDRDNWHAVVALRITPAQQATVSELSHLLLLCHYEDMWHPLAVYREKEVIGCLIWGSDPTDGSCWLRGVRIDQRWQGQGYGRAAVQAALKLLAAEHGCCHFVLAYNPANTVARRLYQTLGFVETEERMEGEVVARLHLGGGVGEGAVCSRHESALGASEGAAPFFLEISHCLSLVRVRALPVFREALLQCVKALSSLPICFHRFTSREP
jgi:diamine N-acetyltransferase